MLALRTEEPQLRLHCVVPVTLSAQVAILINVKLKLSPLATIDVKRLVTSYKPCLLGKLIPKVFGQRENPFMNK